MEGNIQQVETSLFQIFEDKKSRAKRILWDMLTPYDVGFTAENYKMVETMKINKSTEQVFSNIYFSYLIAPCR